MSAAGLAGAAATRFAAPAAARDDQAFVHGVASGDPLPEAVILWTRVTPVAGADPGSGRGPSATVRWEIARDSGFSRIVRSATVVTTADRDHTVKVDVTGLTPGTRYYYRFTLVDGPRAGQRSRTGRTWTAPATAAAVDRLRIGVCSCANYEAGYFQAYRAMAQRDDLDLVLHLGDYTYEYGTGEYPGVYGTTVRRTAPDHDTVTPADYRIRFGRYRSDPDLALLHARVPFLCMWDDHESANDSWRNGAENHDPAKQGSWRARKAASTQAYFEWMPVRPNAIRGGQHLYRRLRFGSLAEIIVPDLRSYRDEQLSMTDFREQQDTNRTMTGKQQYRWLEDSVTTSGARWQVVGTSVMIAPLVIPTTVDPQVSALLRDQIGISEDGVALNLDQWDGYPAERRSLLKAIDKAGRKGVVFVTGDIHSSWASELPLSAGHYGRDARGRVAACEFVAPSITSASVYDTIATSRALAPAAAAATTAAEQALPVADPWIKQVELTRHGYGVLEVTRDTAGMRYYFVDDVLRRSSAVRLGFAWHTRYGKPGLRRG